MNRNGIFNASYGKTCVMESSYMYFRIVVVMYLRVCKDLPVQFSEELQRITSKKTIKYCMAYQQSAIPFSPYQHLPADLVHRYQKLHLACYFVYRFPKSCFIISYFSDDFYIYQNSFVYLYITYDKNWTIPN